MSFLRCSLFSLIRYVSLTACSCSASFSQPRRRPKLPVQDLCRRRTLDAAGGMFCLLWRVLFSCIGFEVCWLCCALLSLSRSRSVAFVCCHLRLDVLPGKVEAHPLLFCRQNGADLYSYPITPLVTKVTGCATTNGAPISFFVALGCCLCPGSFAAKRLLLETCLYCCWSHSRLLRDW
jgi:hypothetical protein